MPRLFTTMTNIYQLDYKWRRMASIAPYPPSPHPCLLFSFFLAPSYLALARAQLLARCTSALGYSASVFPNLCSRNVRATAYCCSRLPVLQVNWISRMRASDKGCEKRGLGQMGALTRCFVRLYRVLYYFFFFFLFHTNHICRKCVNPFSFFSRKTSQRFLVPYAVGWICSTTLSK
jgi:hypothetical protein